MKKRSRKIMIAMGVVLVVIGSFIIFFNISFSPLNNEFMTDMNRLSLSAQDGKSSSISETDIAGLPQPVQKYFRYCGFINVPQMSYMKAEYKKVIFKQGRNGRTLTIDYTQYNYVKKPERIALINSSLFGIPFNGYDSYIDGNGSMKGVIGKLVTLFNQKGKEMDKACLVTFLSECLLVPEAALQDYIKWEAIDDTHARATITCYNISATGIFTFNESGEMLSFTTDDRALYNNDGSIEHVRWSAICGDYKEQNGYKLPTKFKAVWHYDDGDFVYFDGDNIRIEYY